jgi:glutamate racemase
LSNADTPAPAENASARPIGLFDSGVGGVSVLREIQRQLPAEDLIYVADSAHAPYGDKPVEDIQERAFRIVEFLLDQRVKAIVVACNTATGVAVEALRGRWPLPFVAIEPAVKPAAAATRTGIVGVLATRQTIASPRFARLAETWAHGARILAQPCPGLVEQIERGELSTDKTRQLVAAFVHPLVEQGADTLVLGCTHYPFVEPLIAEIAGPGVTLINPSAAVARELRRRLTEASLLAAGPPAAVARSGLWQAGEGGCDVPSRVGMTRFVTSGPPERLAAMLATLGIESGPVGAL